MKIKEINISVEASKNYQKFIIGASIEANESVNMGLLKQIEDKLINESVIGLNELCNKLDLNTETQSQIKTIMTEPIKPINNYQNNNYRQNNFKPYSQYQPRPCTEGQANVLRNYGYNEQDIFNLNSKEAGLLIKQLRGE